MRDRRLLVLAEEFAGTLRSFKGGSGHLAPLLRGAWDSGNLPTFDMRQLLSASNTHVSLIAHIPQHELARAFHRTEAHNGFANRCLWTWVERSNCLPHAGSPPPQELSLAVAPLRDVSAGRRHAPRFSSNASKPPINWEQCGDSIRIDSNAVTAYALTHVRGIFAYMSRLARMVVPDLPHHVTQRGNRREPIFFQDDDQQIYCDMLAEQLRK